MILNQKETTFAYRCPHCGTAVMSMVGAFALSADMLRLKCPCGQSQAEIVYSRDKKMQLSIPCLLCSTPHRYTVPSQTFFSSEILRLPCAYSGVDIAFIGKTDEVSAALDAAQKELETLLDGVSMEQLAAQREESEGVFSDPQIMDIVLYVLNELRAEGGIHCRCEDGEGDYTVDIGTDYVAVSCKRCGAKTVVEADSIVSANAFLHCTHLELE